MRLETLVLELMADDSKASAAVDRFVERAAKKVQGLERSLISPKVDLKQLHELNRVLDVKQKHIKQVADYAAKTPIKVKVDASEVKAAKAEIASLRGQLSGMSATVRMRVEHRFTNADDRRNTNDIVRSVNILGGGLKDIVQAVKGSKTTAGTIARGQLLAGGISSLTGDFRKGAKSYFDAIVASNFGSMELLGEKLTGAFVDALAADVQSSEGVIGGIVGDLGLNNVARHLSQEFKSFKETLMDEVDSLLGEDKILEYGAFAKARKDKRQAKTAQGREGALLVARQSYENVQDAENRVANLNNQASRLGQRRDNASTFLNQQIAGNMPVQEMASIAPLIVKVDKILEMAGAADVDTLKTVNPEYFKFIEQDIKSIESAFKQLQSQGMPVAMDFGNFQELSKSILGAQQVMDGYEEQIERVNSEIEKAQKDLSNKVKVARKSKKNLETVTPQKINSTYYEAAKAVFGDDINPEMLPKVSLGKDMKFGEAGGEYNPYQNSINLSQDMFEAFQVGAENIQLLEVLIHELRHAKQFNMGSFKGFQVARNKQGALGVNPVTPQNTQELQYVEEMLGQYGDDPFTRQVESDAYLFARRETERIGKAKNKERNQGIALKYFGAMGEKIPDKLGSSEISKQSKRVDYLSTQFDQLGIEGKEELVKFKELFDSYGKQIQDLQKIAADIAIGASDADAGAVAELVAKKMDLFSQGVKAYKLSEQKYVDSINKAKDRAESIKPHQSKINSLTERLDQAANTEDIKALRTIRKEIKASISNLKKDPLISEEDKKALLDEFNHLRTSAKLERKLTTKTKDMTLVEKMLNPWDAVQLAVEKKVDSVTDSALALVDAFTTPLINAGQMIANNPMMALAAGGKGLLQAGNAGVRAIAPAVSGAYGVASGLENAALSILPYGHLAKKGLQIGAVTAGLPMAATAIPALAPVAGMLGMAHGAGAAGAGALAAGQIGAISSIPIIGGQVAGLLTTAASGLGGVVAEMAAAAVAVNAAGVAAKALTGKVLEPSTKAQIKALQPSQEQISQQVATAGQASWEQIKKLGGGNVRQLAANQSKILPLLPAEQRGVVERFAPKIADAQTAYAGLLPGQRMSESDISLLGKGTGQLAKLPDQEKRRLQEVIKGQLTSIAAMATDFSKAIEGLSNDGVINTMSAAIGKRKSLLTQKAKAVGLSDADIQSAIDVPAVEIANGLTKGAEAIKPQFEAVMVEVAQSGQEGFNKTMKIESPSKWAIERMNFIALGLMAGATANLPKIKGMGEMTAKEYAQAIKMAEMPELPLPVPQLKPELKANLDQYNQEQSERAQHFNKVNKKHFDSINAEVIAPPIDTSAIDQSMQALQESMDQIVAKVTEDISATDKILSEGAYGQMMAILEEYQKKIDELKQAQSDVLSSTMSNEEKATSFESLSENIEALKSEMDLKIDEVFNSDAITEANTAGGFFRDTLENIKGVAIGLVGGLGFVTLANGLKDVAANALLAYRNIEGVYTSSKLVEGGTKYIEKMSDQVLKLGMDYTSTLKQGMSFAAGMVGTSLESQSQDMFLSLSESLSYLQLSGEQYNNALLALQQISSKGVVSMEELRQQLGEAVPGAMAMAAEAMNTNVQGLIQMVESGGLSSEEFMPRFTAMLENRVEGIAPAAESSLTAAMGRFDAGREKTMIDIGANLAPTVIPAINMAADAMIALSENADKVVWSIQSLSIGLASLGLSALASTLAKSITAMGGLGAVTAKTGAAIRAMATTMKGVMTVAIKPLLLMLAAVTAYEVISFAFKTTGSKEVTNALEIVNRQLAKLDKTEIDPIDLKGYVETDNGFLNFLDSVNRSIDETIGELGFFGQAVKNLTGIFAVIPNFGNVEFDRTSKQIEELQKKAGNIISQSTQVVDPTAMSGFVEQLDDFDRKIATTQARITALRSGDAKASAGQIDALGKELQSLNEQRGNLLKQFDEVGQSSREQTRDALQTVRDERKAQLDSLDPKQAPEKVAQLKSEIAGLDKQINSLNAQITTYDQYMQQLGNTLTRQRLTFINLSAAIAQMNQNFEIGISQQKASLITSQIERGLQSQVDELENLQFALYEQTETMRRLQLEFATNQNFLSSDAVSPKDKALVEEIIGKPMTDANMQDVTKLRMQLENQQNAVGKEVIDALDAMINLRTQLAQAGVGVAEANKALAQFELTRRDYIRDTARQFVDLSRQIETQKIQDQRAVEDLQFTIIDTSIQMQRQTRQIQSAYADMATDLNIQLATAEKTLRDTQNNIKVNQMKAANIAIAPGNSDSVARQIDNILLQFVEQSFGLEANERQIKIDVLNLEKERVNLLRRIRELEEANADAIRNHEKQLRDLNRQVFDLSRSMQEAAMQIRRSADDMAESLRRSDITSEIPKAIYAALAGLNYEPKAVAFQGYSAPQQTSKTQYGILPGGQVNQSYQRQLVQPNFSYVDPWNPTPQELARFGGGQSSSGYSQPRELDYDPIANKAYLNQPSSGGYGNMNALEQAQFNNQRGMPLTAPVNSSPAPVTPTQVITPAPNYTPQVAPVNFQSSASTNVGNLVAKAGRAQLTASQAQSLIKTAHQIGIDPITLLTIMLFETAGTLSPSITNSIGSTGLIQFMPNTAKELGTSTAALRKMSFEQQMPFVAKYFQKRGFRPGMSDVEAYATVIGGNPRAQTARDSNGTNAINGLQKMNAGHRGNAIRLLNQLGLQSNMGSGQGDNVAMGGLNFGVPESIELGRTAQAVGDMNNFGRTNGFIEGIRRGAIRWREATEESVVDFMWKPVWGAIDGVQYQLDRVQGRNHNPNQLQQWKAINEVNTRLNNNTAPANWTEWADNLNKQYVQPKGANAVAPSTGRDVSPPPIRYAPASPNKFTPQGFNANSPQYMEVYQREMTPPNVGQFTLPQMPAAPPMLNYEPFREMVQQIDSINKQIIAARMDDMASQHLLSQRQALDSMLQLVRGLGDANRKNNQSYIDQAMSINQMRTNAKGYQTIVESSLQAGTDVYMQYEQQLRSIQDQRIAIQRQLQGVESIRANAMNQLATNKNLTAEQRSQFELTLNRGIGELQILAYHEQQLAMKEQELKNMQRQASANAQNLAFERDRLAAIDGMVAKMGELSSLEYEMGGQLINRTGIMQAQAAFIGWEERAKAEARALKLNASEMGKFVEIRGRMAELNLAKSYRDAIPFVGELTAGMRDMLLDAKSLGEVMSGILKNMATQIFDLLVGKPIQNWLSTNVVSMFGLDQVSEDMPEFYRLGSGLEVDRMANQDSYFAQGLMQPANVFTQSVGNMVLATDTATGSANVFAGALSNGGNIIPSAVDTLTTGLTDIVSAENLATLSFAQALNMATAAVVSFMGALTAQSATSGVLSVFSGGGGGLLGALAGGFTGNTVQLPAFAKGIDEVMSQEKMQSGKSPLLAVLHQGEAVLSTLNGDAQLYRALKQSGEWEQFKAKTPQRYALGSDNVGGSSSYNRPMANSSGGVTVVQNWTVKTNDADSFRKSQKQLDAEAAARYRRTMRK